MLPASLPDGRSIGGRVARPRITTLPVAGSPPLKILEASAERIGLSFYNDGTGDIFLTDDPAETNTDLMFPIPAGASFTPGIAPFIPQNALYAIGVAGHSLRIWELVTMVSLPTLPGPRPAPTTTRKPWSILRALGPPVLLVTWLLGLSEAQILTLPALPAQAGHAGEFLTTNGSVASWAVTAGGSIPAGVIVMWSGTLAAVPAGWQLCDGTLGAPDLRDRFIWGWTAAINPGGTGGSTAYTPAGTNGAPALTMNAYVPAGTNGAPALTMNAYVPAGTNGAPAFTGSALGTHQHELPVHHPAGNFRHLGNFFGSGTSRAGVTGAGGGLPADTTSAAVAMSQAVTAGTPAGTVAAPVFTGTSAVLTGSVAAPVFTGTSAVLTGSVAAPVFTGTAAVIEMPFFKLAFIIKL